MSKNTEYVAIYIDRHRLQDCFWYRTSCRVLQETLGVDEAGRYWVAERYFGPLFARRVSICVCGIH